MQNQNKRVTDIIYRNYGKRYRLKSNEIALSEHHELHGSLDRLRFLLPSRNRLGKKGPLLLMAGVAAVLLSVMSVYYYNLLVIYQQDMMASMGNVQALLQRRNDIAVNLSKAVEDYAMHEGSVFKSVVSLRGPAPIENAPGVSDLEKLSGMKRTPGNTALPATLPNNTEIPVTGDQGVAFSGLDPKNAGGDLLNSLSRIVATAEQYPDLKLSGNFASFMTALIEIEKDIAGERIKFNDKINIYTTAMSKFPVNLFSMLFGFESVPYFEASDEAKRFRKIPY